MGFREGPGNLHVQQVPWVISKYDGVCVTHTEPKHTLSSLPSSDRACLWGGHLYDQLSASPRGTHLHCFPRGGHRSDELCHLLQHSCHPGPPGVLLLSGIRYRLVARLSSQLLGSYSPRKGPVFLWELQKICFIYERGMQD